MKVPGVITGTMQVQADLRGSGATPHAIAASIDGSLGLAMANGTVDNRLLGSTLGSILRQVNLLDLVGRGGTSQIQCFAARLDAAHGIATVRTLVLASSLLTMDGSGSLNLGTETLDLRVRPQARVAGTSLVVPMRISGPFRSPATAPDAAAGITENAGTVAGAVLGNTTPRGWPPARWARSNCSAARRSIAVRPSRVLTARRAPRHRPPRLRSPHRNSSQSLRTSVAC